MFCPKCATQNTDDASFCRSCGTDISLVPQAVTGQLAQRLAAENDDTRHGRRHRRHRGDKGPPSIERAVKSLFMGLTFVLIALSVLIWVPAGSMWWFWMLLPAAGLLSDAVSTYLRLAEGKKSLTPPYSPPQSTIPSPRPASALPPRNTGEIIPPPSVTEGTTRHLNTPVERTRGDV
jgi:hypothetical protein